MNFEDYLAEAKKAKFAIHFVGKWHEDQSLPFTDVKDIHSAIVGGKRDITSLKTWFAKQQRGAHFDKIIFEDVTSKLNGGQVEVTFKYHHADVLVDHESSVSKIKIQNA